VHWMWIDRILEIEPGRRIVTIKHVSLSEEHLHDHFPAVRARPGVPARPAHPIMPASLIIEGVAQSGGILLGHSTGFAEKIVLAKIARVEFERDAGPGDSLRYEVTIDRADRQGATTSATVELLRPGSPPARMGRVELIFSHLDNSMGLNGGPELPAHNFVFGESFRTLLRLSGIEHTEPAAPSVTSH
jgi:3-hydroxyacyl-[acyl-carrier-protein] dehydratase